MAKKHVKAERRTIEAEDIYVVDFKGRRRVHLSTDDQTGAPLISMFNEELRARLVIGLELGNGPGITLRRENGQAAIGIGEGDDGRVAITMFDSNGKLGIVFCIHPNGDRDIQVLDASLTSLWRAPE